MNSNRAFGGEGNSVGALLKTGRTAMDTGLLLSGSNRIQGLLEDADEPVLLREASCVRKFQRREALRFTPGQAVQLLKSQGIPAKIFCVHRGRKQHFEAQSRDYNWKVMPLKGSNVPVPAPLLVRIQILQEHNIPVQWVLVAKPKQQLVSDVLRAQASIQSRALSEEMASLLVGVLAGATSADQLIRDSRNQGRNALGMAVSGYLPDPVLLVKMPRHPELIEIARWI